MLVKYKGILKIIFGIHTRCQQMDVDNECKCQILSLIIEVLCSFYLMWYCVLINIYYFMIVKLLGSKLRPIKQRTQLLLSPIFKGRSHKNFTLHLWHY